MNVAPIYDGMSLEFKKVEAEYMGDGWLRVPGASLWLHTMVVEGQTYIDGMRIEPLTLWQKIKAVFT